MAGLKFRVLLDTKESSEIFRDILIGDEDNFESLYRSILKAFGFSEQQMASFYMSNDEWDKGHEISLFDMSFGDEPDDQKPSVMSTSRIRDFIEEADQKMILVHDFLRMWIFLIELIGYEKDAPAQPMVLLSVGDAPDESSKLPEDDLEFGGEDELYDEEEDEDDYGFNDFEEGYEDYNDFDDYNQ